MTPKLPPLSVLDLAPVPEGTGGSEAIRRTVELARAAERLGYVRHWFAEHHGMPSVASSSPEVLIAHVAGATRTLRVGSGGIMLPNHVPLRIAEAFRTLEALYPDRIDLGIGRAPGADRAASQAMRAFDGEDFPALMAELRAFAGGRFATDHPLRNVKAMPDDAPLPPVWILGSSGASAQYAGSLGAGYSFASHFSPAPPGPAFEAYRGAFRPSEQFPAPHTILGVAVVCAETEERAQYLASTMRLAWLRIRRGEFRPLPSPEEATAYPYTDAEKAATREYERLAIVGTAASVRARLAQQVTDCAADEIMVVCNVYDHAARLRSYELLANG